VQLPRMRLKTNDKGKISVDCFGKRDSTVKKQRRLEEEPRSLSYNVENIPGAATKVNRKLEFSTRSREDNKEHRKKGIPQLTLLNQ